MLAILFAAIISHLFLSASSASVDQYLDKCVLSKNHKQKPGREGKAFAGHCSPWSDHSCCTSDTAEKIEKDTILSLYNMLLDQCPTVKNMSSKCRRHFKKDTCFYECSPSLAPWIVEDKVSKVTRKERIVGVPICADECEQWFDDCKFDYTCSGNWGNSSGWNWKKKGTPAMCKQPCKTFKDYYKNPKTFCEKLFNHSFKYGSKNASECMSLWPSSWKDNQAVARKFALERMKNHPTAFAENVHPHWLHVALFVIFSLFMF